jgi:hypothetical protein
MNALPTIKNLEIFLFPLAPPPSLIFVYLHVQLRSDLIFAYDKYDLSISVLNSSQKGNALNC